MNSEWPWAYWWVSKKN